MKYFCGVSACVSVLMLGFSVMLLSFALGCEQPSCAQPQPQKGAPVIGVVNGYEATEISRGYNGIYVTFKRADTGEWITTNRYDIKWRDSKLPAHW